MMVGTWFEIVSQGHGKMHEKLVSELASVGGIRLPDCCLGKSPKSGFETLDGVVHCCSHWGCCIQYLSSSVWLFNLRFCNRFFTVPRYENQGSLVQDQQLCTRMAE